MVSWERKIETTLCNYHMLRTGSKENKNQNEDSEVQAPHREICLHRSSAEWIFSVHFLVSFQALNCLWILMTSKWVASVPHPLPFFTLLCNLNLPASKFCLLDVLHTEIAAALGVGLLLLSGGNLIIRAICVGCS